MCLRSFQAAMKRLRHVDVTITQTLSGVVISGLSGGGLSFFTARLSKTCLQTRHCLFITSETACHVSNTCTCFKKSKRDISVIVDSLDGDLSLLTLNFLRNIAIGTTIFQYQTANETITLPVYRSTCTSCILKLG